MLKFTPKNALFCVTVLIPTLLSILYFSLFASDIYISEAQFVVRSPEKQSPSGLGMLLKSSGFANAGDEIYAAKHFVLSRDALRALNKQGKVNAAYGNSHVSIFNRFNALGLDGSFEELYKYYTRKVAVELDTASSIVTVTVKAFTPKDAQYFNQRLLSMAEDTVNKINNRGREDLITFAQREVDEAQYASQAAALSLAHFRNQQGIIDPDKQAAIQLQMISKLQDELILTRTQLRELEVFAPQNPQVDALKSRIQGLNAEIAHQSGMIAGSNKSLSSQATEYQRLMLNNQFAEKQLASAMASLENARNEARRKQAYVERIVEPNLPDKALEPRRFRGIISTLILGLAAWGILSMLIAGMLEHKD